MWSNLSHHSNHQAGSQPWGLKSPYTSQHPSSLQTCPLTADTWVMCLCTCFIDLYEIIWTYSLSHHVWVVCYAVIVNWHTFFSALMVIAPTHACISQLMSIVLVLTCNHFYVYMCIHIIKIILVIACISTYICILVYLCIMYMCVHKKFAHGLQRW